MGRQKGLAVVALSALLVVATILGCGANDGLRFIDAGGQTFVPHFAYVSNSSPDCSGCSPMNISAFSINANTGALTAVPGSPFDTAVSGAGNMIIDVDPGSNFLFVPTRNADSVQVFSINKTTGALTEVTGSPFPTGDSDAYCVEVDESGKFLYVSNRGSDTITAFTIGANGSLTMIGSPVVTQSFGNPRHLAIHPQGKFLYASVFSEGILVEGWAINSSTGALTAIPGSPFSPSGLSAPKNLAVDNTGKFLLVPDNGNDRINVLSIDQTTGALTEVSGSPFSNGEGPMTITEAVVGGQTYVISNNVSGGNISVFTFNTTTGTLTPVSGSPFDLGFTRPHWITVGGNFAYGVDQNSNNIRGAAISQAGSPSAIAGSPFTGGGLSNPAQIVIAY